MKKPDLFEIHATIRSLINGGFYFSILFYFYKVSMLPIGSRTDLAEYLSQQKNQCIRVATNS